MTLENILHIIWVTVCIIPIYFYYKPPTFLLKNKKLRIPSKGEIKHNKGYIIFGLFLIFLEVINIINLILSLSKGN